MKNVLAFAAIIALVFISTFTQQPAHAASCVFTGTLDLTNLVDSYFVEPVAAGERADFNFTPDGMVDVAFRFLYEGGNVHGNVYYGFNSYTSGWRTFSRTVDEIRITLTSGTSLTYTVTVTNCGEAIPVTPVPPVTPVAPSESVAPVIVETSPVAAITDGRINPNPGAPIAVYCVDGGVHGYRIDGPELGTLVLDVSAAELAEFSEIPATNTLIASDGGIRLYRLTSGELQANYSLADGQEYVYIWENCAPGSGEETTSYYN